MLRRNATRIDSAGTPGRSIDHFDRGGGLEDIHRRATLCGEGRGARDVAIQFQEQPPGVVGQVRRILTQDIAGHDFDHIARGERSEAPSVRSAGVGPRAV